MSNGFSILEAIIVLTLTLVIVSIVISSVFESTDCSKKVSKNQQVLESIFHTVDTVKSDLSKCGMRLQEAARCFKITLFEKFDFGFKVHFGITSTFIRESVLKGSQQISVEKNDFLKKKKRLLIYNPDTGLFEYNRIRDTKGNQVFLVQSLKNDYLANSDMVVLKQICYKFFPKQKVLKRKIDNGHYQPLIDNVTDFFVTFFSDSNSVLYRIEVNKKEQIRGYIFLRNMVH